MSMTRTPSDSSTELAICKGGKGKICGNRVTDDDLGVECDRCKSWFHIECQGVSEPAHDALNEHKCFFWFCEKCQKSLGKDWKEQQPALPHQSDDKFDAAIRGLESKVQDVAESVREHMKILVQSLKEQEETVSTNTKLLQRTCLDQNSQRVTYADMVRGTCEKVVKDVGAKIDTLPSKVTPSGRDMSETTNAISRVFDSFMDREKRKLNVVVHNLPEQDGDTLAERMEKDQLLFKEVIKEGMNLIVRPIKAFRVGRKIEDRPRLLIVTLDNAGTKADILKLATQLRHLTKWKRIYVTPDLSKKEREDNKRLREELSARRQAGEEDLVIRRGRIVKGNTEKVPKPTTPSREDQNPTGVEQNEPVTESGTRSALEKASASTTTSRNTTQE